jgi:hypothetical protein
MIRIMALAALALLSAPAAAQSGGQPSKQDGQTVTVTGQRDSTGRPIPMSDWQVAETEHVLVYAKDDEKRLTRIAANLEKLHFLLSVLLNRVDAPDETLKLKVVLIGDSADFKAMRLRPLRSQQGPYPDAFPSTLYYDPRDDGAVLATSHDDQKIIVEQGVSIASLSSLQPADEEGPMEQSAAGPGGAVSSGNANEVAYGMSAEGRLYAGFARHYLLTYFPAAYPRWYVEGFGEIFSTLSAPGEGRIEYGRAPDGLRQVIEAFGRYEVQDVLAERYLADKRVKPIWTPYHAWRLTHLLFFSEEWSEPLRRYLAAYAAGKREEAAAGLDPTGALQRTLGDYRGRKVPFEVMTYPADRIEAPHLRRLTRFEAGIVRGRLELGARVTLPPEAEAGAPPKAAARALQARADAAAERARYLQRLRDAAARQPSLAEGHVLLAEAECRSGNSDACLRSADAALALSPADPEALAWKGAALAAAAAAAPAEKRKGALKEARAALVRANRANTAASVPLISYYRSYADAGEAVPDRAVEGLLKASESVPASTATALLLGAAYIRRGDTAAARRTLRPIAEGAYGSPERAEARRLLAGIGG